jgi:hypothetical protein
MNRFQMEICYVKVRIVCGCTIHDARATRAAEQYLSSNPDPGRVRFVGVQYIDISASQPPQR